MHSNVFHGKLNIESIHNQTHVAVFRSYGAFMLQEMWLLVLYIAARLSGFCDFAADQCVTVTCMITARFNRKERSATFSVPFSHSVEKTLFLGTVVQYPSILTDMPAKLAL